jgi:hypothetical protein
LKLCVLSCCYEKPELAAILRESCGLFGYDLLMCEAAELNGKWPASGDMRVGKMVAALETMKLIQETRAFTHVLWADGFDTFVCRTELRFHFAWDQLGSPPLVLSAEKNCWPDPDKAAEYPASDSPYRFINAGTWMGQIDYLVDVITKMLAVEWPDGNDQRAWTDAYLGGLLPGAVIDTERQIFQTMWGTERHEVNTDASVIHYNGGIWRNPEDKRMIEHWESVKPGRSIRL